MPKKKKKRREDYDVVDLPAGTVTFGTALFMRNDRRALRIVFPAGEMVTFAPEDEIDEMKGSFKLIT